MTRDRDASPSASELLVAVQTLLGAQELDDVRAAVAHAVTLISRCDSVALYECVGTERRLGATRRHGEEPASTARALEELLAARALETGRTVSTLDRLEYEAAQFLSDAYVSKNSLCLARPLRVYGELAGVLAFHFGDRTTLHHGEFDMLRRFVDFAAVALANARTRTELRSFAFSDPLTGLGNRRRLEAEFRRLQGTELSLLLVDFDGLKAVNDTLGYDRGDALIRAVAVRLAATVTGDEFAVRFGGDEFVIVLPGASREIAVRRAEELTSILDGCSLPADLASRFRGASVGYAASDAGEDVWTVLGRASAEMRSRKRRRKTDRGHPAAASVRPTGNGSMEAALSDGRDGSGGGARPGLAAFEKDVLTPEGPRRSDFQ